MPLDVACLIGCGVSTGVGAVRNTVSVQPGNYVKHFEFVQSLLNKYDIPPARRWVDIDNIASGINPTGAAALLDVAFKHNIKLFADALGAPPAELVQRTKQASIVVTALVGRPKHAQRQTASVANLDSALRRCCRRCPRRSRS